jgi:WD40 repeat protein
MTGKTGYSVDMPPEKPFLSGPLGKIAEVFWHEAPANHCAVWSPDGKRIICGADSSIAIWDAESGRRIRFLKKNYEGIRRHNTINNTILSLTYSHDGEKIFSGGSFLDAWIIKQDNTYNKGFSEFYDGSIYYLAVSPDNRKIVSCARGDRVCIWDSKNGGLISELPDHETSTYKGLKAIWSPDSGRLIINAGNMIKIWDLASEKHDAREDDMREIYTLTGHDSDVISIDLSPDGRRIISGDKDGIIMVWDFEHTGGNGIPLGRPLRDTIFGNRKEITFLSYSPDGKRILCPGFIDNSISICDANDGRELATLTTDSDPGGIVSWSPDGKRIMSAANFNNSVNIWDTKTGRELAKLISFYGDKWVCITPDGYYTSSDKADRKLRARIENKIFTMDRYRSTYFRPDIVAKRLSMLEGDE